MNADDFAARVIARLSIAHGGGRECAPWLLVERTIYTPAEVLALTDEQLRAYPTKTCHWLWSFRGFSEPGRPCLDPSVWLFSDSKAYPLELPIVIFWPPIRPGAPFELVWSCGTDEAVVEAIVWLVCQPLEPYNGPRMLCKAGGEIPITPTLLPRMIDDERR